MTIKHLGGIFGRNPTFNDVTIEGDVNIDGGAIDGTIIGGSSPAAGTFSTFTSTGIDDNATSTAITIDANENIGIATTSPVNNANRSTLAMQGAWGGQLDIMVGSTVHAQFGTDNFDTGSSCRVQSKDSIVFKMNDSVTGFIQMANGNLAFQSGYGIDFSATSGTGTSELFDDYEEGTWTPVVADASAGGNTATGTFTGTYTKIGRMVTLNAVLIDINTSGMTSGNILYLRNLPFVTTKGHIGSNLMRSVTYSGEVAPRTLDGLSYLYFMEYSSGSATSVLTVGGISSGVADIWFTVTYEV